MRREQKKFTIGSAKTVSINKLVQDVIDSHQPELSERNIVIETDLATVKAVADLQLIRTACDALINHANELMKNGGELSITLIDGNHQWELEVADNAGRFPTSQLELNLMFSEPGSEADEVPTILPFPRSEHLRKAYSAASSHGGQLQTWDCPQGGTAHVLVIPKRTR